MGQTEESERKYKEYACGKMLKSFMHTYKLIGKKPLIYVLFWFIVKIDKDKQLVVLDEEHEVC